MSADTGDRAGAIDWLRGQLHWERRLHELWRAGGVPPSPEPLYVADAEAAEADAAPVTIAAASR